MQLQQYKKEFKALTEKKLQRINIIRLPKLPPHLSSNISIVEFSLPQVQDLPAEVESISELPIDQIPSLKKAYDNLPDPLTEFLKNSNVNWIIHDFAPYWLPRVATLLGINLIFFSTFNATSFVSMGPPSALLGDLQQRPEDFKALHETVNYQHCMDDVSDSQRVGLLIEGCQVVTMRTCFEFEPDEVKLLIKVFQKPAVPVGLLPPSLHWLDSKGEKSVFQIALGSEVNLSEDSMHQLAFGIEKSNLPYIWVVRKLPAGEGQMDDIIPPEFEERVSNSGLVLRDWEPQLRIFFYRALKFGRALIVFSGASADQGLNARLLHGRKVGLEIERNETDGSFTSDLVAETIRQVMMEPKGEAIRANAWAMREIFDNEELSNNCLDGFTWIIEEFAPSACHSQV
ncbi:hypothetical protein V6Z11_A05G032800 [Gossypium hirsutum]